MGQHSVLFPLGILPAMFFLMFIGYRYLNKLPVLCNRQTSQPKGNKPRTMGTDQCTDVVTVNMKCVDIKKIGYKFLLITVFNGFLRCFITDLLDSACTE